MGGRRSNGHTRFCGEDSLIVKKVLHPCHDIVDVRRRRELYALAVLVDPGVVQAGGTRERAISDSTSRCHDVSLPGPCGHGRACAGRTALREHAVELIQVCVEVKDYGMA